MKRSTSILEAKSGYVCNLQVTKDNKWCYSDSQTIQPSLMHINYNYLKMNVSALLFGCEIGSFENLDIIERVH